MKKILTLGLLLMTGMVYGQYRSIDIKTQTRSSSTMVWNDNIQNFDFYDNKDKEEFYVNWHFVLNSVQNKGTIVCNNITYDVKEIKPVVGADKSNMLIIEAATTRSQTKVTVIVSVSEAGSILVAVYEFQARKAYYFN